MKKPWKALITSQALQLGFTLGLALLAVMMVMWSTTARAAVPQPRYVDGVSGSDDTDCTNSSDPCATIAYALNQAEAGDTVLVAEDVYNEALDLAQNVTLLGGYEAIGWTRDIESHPTVIDASGSGDRAFSIPPGLQVTLEGLTVQGGEPTLEGGAVFINGATVVISATVIQENSSDSHGGGVWVEGSANLLIVNSGLLSNSAGGRGGGLAGSGFNPGSSIELLGVLVQDNNAGSDGGGLAVDGAPTIVTASRILSNTSGTSGGGIHATDLEVVASEIRGNEANGTNTVLGGGIAMSTWLDENRLVIRDSVVSDNAAISTDESIGGGIDAERSRATIERTVVRGNEAQYNAGISLYQTVLTMTNSLVISNTGPGISGQAAGTIVNVTAATNAGPGVQIGIDSTVAITNSILWGNGGDDYVCAGDCTLAYSDVGVGDTAGPGNISEDPLFLNAAGGDYRLQTGSPCRNTGTTDGAPLDDITGHLRDAWPDMGAYEWIGIFLPLVMSN
jgi:predicted outer membrane repeat protein